MSASDFRQITLRGHASTAERLFRAAVSAFCSLTRPSRREIAQLEDLTLPLFDQVSAEARRFVAAALSECRYPPKALVDRLCDEPVDVAAPLLIRSPGLTEVDLIALIGRRGKPHARAIARRPALSPTLVSLITKLEVEMPATPSLQPTRARYDDPETAANAVRAQSAVDGTPADRETGAEAARRHLRTMMRPAEGGPQPAVDFARGRSAYAKLRDTALTGVPVFFHTALADALEIDFLALRRMSGAFSYSWLLPALRALDLTEDQAFVVTAAAYPAQFAHPESIRLFLSRYRLLHRDHAIDKVRTWKADSVAAAVGNTTVDPKPKPQARDMAERASNENAMRLKASRSG